MPINGQRADIQLKSEEVQEILSKMPHWVIRWGITLIFTIVALVVLATWFIKYPDKVSAQVLLTTDVPPAKVISQTSGRIDFLVSSDQLVSSGEKLAVIKNASNTGHVLHLMNWLHEPDESTLPNAELQKLELGDMQVAFSNHLNALSNERLRLESNELKIRKGHLHKRIKHHQALSTQIQRQVQLLEEELVIAEKFYTTQEKLFEKQVIAELDLENSERELIRVRRELESMKVAATNNLIQISALNEQLSEVELIFNEKTELQRATVDQTLRQLKKELSDWSQKYLMVSPIAGRVTFVKYWKDDQYLNRGEEVMTVVPDKNEVFGQVFLPVTGSGKVKSGQKVHIRFSNYPSQEFGVVTGRIQDISLVPRDDKYMIRVTLPDGLQTSYNKKLDFKPEMSGSAEIITEELRLIERIFNQFRNLFDRI